MGYYSIRLFPTSKYMTTIVTEFGTFRYSHIPMVMCASGYIFQEKLDELLGDIDLFKTHIDCILVLIKDRLSKNMEQLRIIVGRFRAEGLKVNGPKFSFWLN